MAETWANCNVMNRLIYMTYRYCSSFKKFLTGLLDHQPRPIDSAFLWYLKKLDVLRIFSFAHLC
jgi:hypothetical protein